MKLDQRDDYDRASEQGIEHAVEAELFCGDGKLAVNRQDQERVQFSGSDQLRDV